RVRYTIASAGLSLTSPENAASVLAESSAEIEASPGVAMRLIDRRADDGHSITMRSSASADSSPSEIEIAPPSRANAADRGSPLRGCKVALYDGPSTYHVTTRVHSPTSVGASSSPTSAFSSVDFPAFTRPT